jgi:hypothetical protein
MNFLRIATIIVFALLCAFPTAGGVTLAADEGEIVESADASAGVDGAPSSDAVIDAEGATSEAALAASTEAALAVERSPAPGLELPPAGAPVFHIQLWDAQKTGWTDEHLDGLVASGFTVVQNGWGGSLFPSLQTLDRVRRHGLLYGVYINTRQLFAVEAETREKEQVRHAVLSNGTQSKSEFNTFDPIYQAVVRRGIQKGLARIAAAGNLYKIMVNSEHAAPISYDDLTIARAIEAGVLKEGEKIPVYDGGVLKSSAPAALAYNFISWIDTVGGDLTINLVAAEAARAARPGVLVTTDPISTGLSYGQYRGMEIMQDWLRVHRAPRDPLSIAYHCEILKAHARHEGKGDIWIGPQLGSKEKSSAYAAPADEFEEALWLAAAFGAKGATLWGYDTLRRGNPLDDDTWSRIGKFKRELVAHHADIIGAKDAPRACAVLFCREFVIFSHRANYRTNEDFENFYRAILTAHVPADVINDDDVAAGNLSRYKAVFIPGSGTLMPDVDKAVAEFEKSGGRVIRWEVKSPVYLDYEITKGHVTEDADPTKPAPGSLLPHQYRAWRRIEAGKLFAKVADLMDVQVDNPDVILNVVEVGGGRSAVLVNDARTYGAWTKERGFRWCEDEGLPSDATLTIGRGDSAKTVKVSLPAAGIAVVPLGGAAGK